MTRPLLISALLASAIACSTRRADTTNSTTSATPQQATPVTVNLSGANGASVGTAMLSPDATGVRITLAVNGLSADEHAIHVHQTAQCDGPAFTSAGGHSIPSRSSTG